MNTLQKPITLFYIIWVGQLLSKIGSGMSAFAIGIYLFQYTGNTSTYSLFLLCAFLPSVLFAPVGGVLADRKDRKLLMLLGDLCSLFGIVFIIVMILLYPNWQWPLYGGIALSSLGVGLHSPAFKATVTDLLEVKEYSKASGLIQLAEASRYLVSPIIAGFLLFQFSLPVVLFIDVMTFMVAAMAVIWIRSMTIQPEYRSQKKIITDFIDGIEYLGNNVIVCRLLYISTIVTFLAGILQVLMVPIVLSFTDSPTLGLIQSIAASGMLVGSLIIGMWSTSDKQYRVLSCSLGGAGVFYLLIGMSTDTLLFTMTAFCFFMTLPFVNTSLEVLLRQNIISEMQGRIWSLISLVSQLGMLVALSITGVLADRLFNPLLMSDGYLAKSIGQIVGIGPARGSGLMVVVAGFFLILTSVFISKWVRDQKKFLSTPLSS